MRDIIRAFSGSIASKASAKDLAIEIESITPPFPQDISDPLHAGGMPGPVDVPLGTEWTDASFKIAGYNMAVIGSLGLPYGEFDVITFNGAAVSETDGTKKRVELVLNGRLTDPSPDAWERGSRSGIEFSVRSLRYVKLSIGGRVMHDINMITGSPSIVNGIDTLSEINSLIGV